MNQKIQNFFSILKQDIHDHPLVYLDNAATMQMPEPVLSGVDQLQAHLYPEQYWAAEDLRTVTVTMDPGTAKARAAKTCPGRSGAPAVHARKVAA